MRLSLNQVCDGEEVIFLCVVHILEESSMCLARENVSRTSVSPVQGYQET